MPRQVDTEDRLIARWIRNWPAGRGTLAGPGDDCALIAPAGNNRLLVLKTDAVVENVHFLPEAAPQKIGAKAVNRVLSDFAAMAATPQALLVTIGLPTGRDPAFVGKCYAGMRRAAQKFHVGLAGGETTRSGEFWLSVTGFGHVAKKNAVLRSGARAGDLIYITGTLGGSQQGRHLDFAPRLNEGQWLARNKFATGMMDLSDGLGRDLPRMARASAASFAIDPALLPLTNGCTSNQAVNEGEDYELLFTVPPKKAAELKKKWPFRLRLTCCGQILPRHKKPETGGLVFTGFDHFLK